MTSHNAYKLAISTTLFSSALLIGCGTTTSPIAPRDRAAGDAIDEAASDSLQNKPAVSSKDENHAGMPLDPAPGPVRIQLLAINDFHGNIEPPTGTNGLIAAPSDDPSAIGGADAGVIASTIAGQSLIPAGGAAFLATHIKQMRATNPNTVVVSAGDLTGASPFVSNTFDDEPTTLVMNAMGLDIEAVGNHDFERGVAKLKLIQSGYTPSVADKTRSFVGAKYQYLAANVNTHARMTLFPPYAIKTFDGAKVAFIGLTLRDTPSVISSALVRELTFADETQTVNALIPELKAQGVGAIVVLLHQGAHQAPTGTYDTCDSLKGDLLPLLAGNPATGAPGMDRAVDVVVSAHTHQAYNCVIDGRLVTSASAHGRLITKIDLTIDPSTKSVTSKQARNVIVTRDVTPDVEVQSIVATYEALSAVTANKVVGYIAQDIKADRKGGGRPSCESHLGDLLADAHLAATRSEATGGAVIAFTNPGGMRADLLAKGPTKADFTLTYADAFAAQPFSNDLITVTLTGAQILDGLKQQFDTPIPRILQVSSGFEYAYTWSRDTQTGVIDPTSVKLNGTPIDRDAQYRVTINEFLAGGGDGFSTFTSGADALV